MRQFHNQITTICVLKLNCDSFHQLIATCFCNFKKSQLVYYSKLVDVDEGGCGGGPIKVDVI